MNVKLLKNLFVALVAAISISSCSSANDCAMASDEGVAKIKELIKAHVDINECKIYRIEWKKDWKERKLENVLSQISVDYIDKEDNDYNLTINYTDGEFVPEEPRKGKSVLNSYEYTTAIEIDGMNAEKIRHNIASGGELVILQEEGKQYEFKSVEKYMLYMRPVPKDYEDRWKKWSDDYKQEYRQLRQMFELNFIKKDEPKEARGKHIWTNYYTVPFKTNEAGEVEIEQ